MSPCVQTAVRSLPRWAALPAAATRSRPDRAAQHRQTLFETLHQADPTGAVVVRVEASPITEDHVRIVVSDAWHRRHYQERLQGAQAFWRLWASIHAPQEHDRARLELVDRLGNQVGGSRWLAGSVIWVQER